MNGNILRRNWPVAVLLVAAFGLGFLLRGGGDGGEPDDSKTALPEVAAPQRWTCSMHPQIILPTNDQKCPICFMDLIPLEEESGAHVAPGDLSLSEAAAALADIATDKVRREFVAREIRLVGKVSADETRTRTITARVGGRLDRLFVDATGQTVTRGMELAEIYSPELYSAQAELQTAAGALAAAEKAGAATAGARANLRSAAERLRLWGMDEQQIQAIMAGEGISDHLVVRAPVGGVVVSRQATQGDYVKTGGILYTIADLSGVWVTLDAFESDVAWLREDQPVAFTARAYPGREFQGDILFIDPVLDERTRTVEIRVAVDNTAGLLKPGMLVTGRVSVTVDAYGNPVVDPETAVPPLVIPASAPLLTGDRAVVYVRLPGNGDPVFTGRNVVLGPRAGDVYFVVSGLSEGESVVTRGNFKIDSALQIQARTSMMNPAGHEALNGLAPLEPGPCFGQGLKKVLQAYYPLQTALAADDDAAARAAAGEVKAAADNLDCDTADLPRSGAELWSRLETALRDAAGRTASADNIARRRQAFESLSDNLWNALARFGAGSGETVRRFHCPMAFDNDGAFWIQQEKTTANPYYGAMMLRCGSQEEVLGGEGGGS
ncbi:MAG: efflux RND transporter periplasmic adaptor subunit [Candidatus Krumholzibacteriota bacterium]